VLLSNLWRKLLLQPLKIELAAGQAGGAAVGGGGYVDGVWHQECHKINVNQISFF
jgi:hypothetical protein